MMYLSVREKGYTMKINNSFTPAEIAWLKELHILGNKPVSRKCVVRKLTPEERKKYGLDSNIGTE